MSAPRERKPPLVLCIAVLGSIAVMCVVVAAKGHSRYGEYTYYIYDNGDAGHPGLVTMVATFAFWTVSVLSAVLAVTTRRVAWVISSLLFLMIGADYLIRAHNHFAGGDAVARLVYWAVFAYVLNHMWRGRRSLTTRVLIVIGLALFALSDVVDLMSNESYGRGAALEESTGCLGSWCLALATLGVVQTLLSPREHALPRLTTDAP
ncbi:MAG TPA: hypothetical protein VH761_04445 [Ilumatobacteraceae bacterium]